MMGTYFVIDALRDMEDLAMEELGVDYVERSGGWLRGTYYDSGGFDLCQHFTDGKQDIIVYWSWISKEAYL